MIRTVKRKAQKKRKQEATDAIRWDLLSRRLSPDSLRLITAMVRDMGPEKAAKMTEAKYPGKWDARTRKHTLSAFRHLHKTITP